MARRRPGIEQNLLTALQRESSYVVAVSGGVDSMVLLTALGRVINALKSKIHVAHINHKTRSTSDADAAFVKAEADRQGIPFHVLELSLDELSGNFEAWARTRRYDFLEQIRSRENLEWILTAHHAGDVAETLLMRLFANKEANSIRAMDTERHHLRPFLLISRSQIEVYAQKNVIHFREDSTNRDLTFTRNKIRHKIIPLLRKEFSPSVDQALAERAGVLAADELFFSDLVKRRTEALGIPDFDSSVWTGAFVRLVCCEEDAPVAWRMVEYVFFKRLGYALGFRRSQAVVEFIKNRKGMLNLPSCISLTWVGKGKAKTLRVSSQVTG